jgi:hypothetical protein
MVRFAAIVLLIPILFSGCALCTNCEDENYSAFGGRWERDVANHGRVGSAFEEAGHRIEGAEFAQVVPEAAEPAVAK